MVTLSFHRNESRRLTASCLLCLSVVLRETFFEFILKLNCSQNSFIFRAVFRLNGLCMKRCCMERTPAKVICKYIYSLRANRSIRTTESYQQTDLMSEVSLPMRIPDESKTPRLPLIKRSQDWRQDLKIGSSLFCYKLHSPYSYVMIAIHKTKNCSRKSKICKPTMRKKQNLGRDSEVDGSNNI